MRRHILVDGEGASAPGLLRSVPNEERVGALARRTNGIEDDIAAARATQALEQLRRDGVRREGAVPRRAEGPHGFREGEGPILIGVEHRIDEGDLPDAVAADEILRLLGDGARVAEPRRPGIGSAPAEATLPRASAHPRHRGDRPAAQTARLVGRERHDRTIGKGQAVQVVDERTRRPLADARRARHGDAADLHGGKALVPEAHELDERQIGLAEDKRIEAGEGGEDRPRAQRRVGSSEDDARGAAGLDARQEDELRSGRAGIELRVDHIGVSREHRARGRVSIVVQARAVEKLDGDAQPAQTGRQVGQMQRIPVPPRAQVEEPPSAARRRPEQ